MMLFIVAAIAVMLSVRSGIDSEIVVGSRVFAITCAGAALGILFADARKLARLRRPLQVHIYARRGGPPTDLVGEGDIEDALAGGRLAWLVSEIGFTQPAIDRATQGGARCFALRNGAFVEVSRT